MILRNYIMLAVVFKCLACFTFDDVTERLVATTRRQADRQQTSQARNAEGDEQAMARRDENRKRTCQVRSEADEYIIKF